MSTTQKTDSEALRAARAELQAFKWATLETVNADPLFEKSATCHKVMHVALQFLNVDIETLERLEVFLPHAIVMAKTGLCKNSVKKAKALLCAAGYLVPRGRMQNGIEVYMIRNPRKDLVGAHIDETLAYLKQEEAERRSEDRRRASLKRMSNNAVGSRNDTMEMGGGVTECHHGGSNFDPNTLDDTLDGSGIEEDRNSITSPNAYAAAKNDQKANQDSLSLENAPNLEAMEVEDLSGVPFPVPDSDDEAEDMVSQLCAGHEISERVFDRIKMALVRGVLTESLLVQMLAVRKGGKERVAA